MADLATMDMAISGFVDDGEEVYHELVWRTGIRYTIELEADDEDADLDLYITNDANEVLYEDEEESAGAACWFEPGYSGVYRLFIRSHDGGSDYTVSITE